MSFPTDPQAKAFAQKAATSFTKTAWQELLDRHATVPAWSSVEAAEVARGISGSWASVYALEDSVRSREYADGPAPIQTKENHIGQPGMAEINFRPYDHHTNRHASKGPSLLGHPISFSVVGPTLKSPFLDHQWLVTDVGGSDVLTLDSASVYSTVGTPAVPTHDRIYDIYGITALPENGLYLVVSQTGSRGALGAGVGGLGDGQTGLDAVVPAGGARAAAVPTRPTSKYEIFRVVALSLDGGGIARGLVLDSGKRLSSHFTFTGGTTPVIRAVTLLTPAATRVIAVPGSGAGPGKEQVFAVVPPERALNSDLMPPFKTWATTGGSDPWTNFATAGAQDKGTSATYGDTTCLPVPIPRFSATGHVQDSIGPVVLQSLGLWRVLVDVGQHWDVVRDVGKILHIHSVETVGITTSVPVRLADKVSHPTFPEDETPLRTLLGHYEIIRAIQPGAEDTRYYELRRVVEFDPATGVPFYGTSTFFQTVPPDSGVIKLVWTLHDPIRSLWTVAASDITALSAARLTNLVDPSLVRPSLKRGAGFPDLPARPDRAVFDTATSGAGAAGSNANPGSLLDLGFRAVLFPAKVGVGNVLVPDFATPMAASEIVLDTAKTMEDQWVEVDYSAGLIRLSHALVVGSPLLPTAGLLTAVDNPRKEAVFFVSCVPYSREPGQTGTSSRVTGAILNGDDGDICLSDNPETTDTWSGRTAWNPVNGAVLTSQIRQDIKLSTQLLPTRIPQTGFVEMVTGTRPVGPVPSSLLSGTNRAATFGYNKVVHSDAGNGGNTTLKGVYGGGPDGTTVTPSAEFPHRVVLRRDVVTPSTTDGRVGTDFQFDTTYGFAARSTALHFENASIRKEIDGSSTVKIKDPETTAHRKTFGAVFSSGLLSGGLVTIGAPDTKLDVTETVVLIDGIRSVLLARTEAAEIVGNIYYVYVDGTSPSCPVLAFSETLPLPSQHDVLLARYVQAIGHVTQVIDLRNPLVDIDLRTDILVGDYTGHYGGSYQPHFRTLSAAVRYVGEVMDPPDAGGAGDHPRSWRITVVGPVTEVGADLPIVMPTHGMIIEGNHRKNDGGGAAPDSPSTIRWSDDTKPLFDMNGKDFLTYRELSLKYTGTPATANGAGCAFTVNFANAASSFDSSNVTIENVNFHGGTRGVAFLLLNATASATGAQMTNLVIRGCSGLTDCGGIWTNTTDPVNTPALVNARITDNDFVCTKAPAVAAVGDLVRLVGRDCHVARNSLGVATAGIHVTGTGNRITENRVYDTEQAGIFIETDHNAVIGNHLELVHTDNSNTLLGQAGKYGIVVRNLDGLNYGSVRVEANQVSLDSGGEAFNPLTHYALYGTSKDNVVTGNICHGTVGLGGTGAVVTGNHVDHRVTPPWLIVGPDSLVTGNVFTGSGLFGVGCTVQGNRGGDVGLGIRCSFTGNRVDDVTLSQACLATDNTVGKFVTTVLTEHVTLTGNYITDSMIGADALFLENSTVHGNIFENDVTVQEGSHDVSFRGNRVDATGGALYGLFVEKGCTAVVVDGNTIGLGILVGADAELKADQVHVTDNNVTGDLIVYSDRAVVVGNNVSGGIGVVGTGPKVLHNEAAGQQILVRPDPTFDAGLGVDSAGGGAVVAFNKTTQGLYVLGTHVRVDSNRFSDISLLDVVDSTIIGNVSSFRLYVNGPDNIVQGNRVQSIASRLTAYGVTLSAPNGVFVGNAVFDILLGAGSTNVVVQGNRVSGVIWTAMDDGLGSPVKADQPTIVNNDVGSDIVCSVIVGAIVSSSQEPDIHGNRVGGNIICSIATAGGFSGCLNPVITGNRVVNWITVNIGYTVTGNRAKSIGRALLDAAVDADSNGICIGNRVEVGGVGVNAGKIFGTAPTEADSGADTGHRMINTAQTT